MGCDEELSALANNPACSNWLKAALADAIQRDPVDAARDASFLAQVLERRVTQLLAKDEAQLVINQASKRE